MSGHHYLPKFETHAGEWTLFGKCWYWDAWEGDAVDGIARVWLR